MKVKKVRAVKALLEANGWKYSRTKGDHAIYRKEGAPRSIPIPGKDNDEVAIDWDIDEYLTTSRFR